MAFDYFYGAQSQQFAFYRIPKVLFTDNRFQKISTEGKVLYGLLLDRVSLSMENGWIDDEGRVYIIFTLTTIRQAMNCAEKSAIKYLTELEEFGLIERIRQGFGKPALIYVKNFIDQQNLQVRTSKNYSSPPVKVTGQEVIDRKLAVVDLTASIMCMENKMPMYVFGLNEPDSIVNAMSGKFNGTKVTV